MENIMKCAYMIPYASGDIKCFKNNCSQCSSDCNSKLPLCSLKEIYPDIKDLPSELLNLYINDCVIQDVGSDCHNLFLVLSLYFDSLDSRCKYKGVAYRYTTKKKDKPKISYFYNFSQSMHAYNGGSGLTNNQRKNHLWEVIIEGIKVDKFIELYCLPIYGNIFKKSSKNYIERIKFLSEKEQLIIGQPITEAIYINKN